MKYFINALLMFFCLSEVNCMMQNYKIDAAYQQLLKEQLVSRAGYLNNELKKIKQIIDTNIKKEDLTNWKEHVSPLNIGHYLFPFAIDLMFIGEKKIGADMILYYSNTFNSDNFIFNYLTEKGIKEENITTKDIISAFDEMLKE